jgi:hypothetical protein
MGEFERVGHRLWGTNIVFMLVLLKAYGQWQ